MIDQNVQVLRYLYLTFRLSPSCAVGWTEWLHRLHQRDPLALRRKIQQPLCTLNSTELGTTGITSVFRNRVLLCCPFMAPSAASLPQAFSNCV